jgi:nucleotide-binding universal stress UspA family protein
MYYLPERPGAAKRRREARRATASILVPVDGSKVAEDAVRHVIGLARSGMAMKVHLLNVQPEAAAALSEYEKREALALQIMAADKASEGARALLAGACLDVERHLRIGCAAEAIARLARQKRCQKIVMGTRRLNTVAGFFLGSVASQVLRLTTVPVTLVREN